MDPTQIGLFDLAERRMAWLDRRAAVLAENVANAETPGWQSHDLLPFEAALAQTGVTPQRTSPLHMAGTVVRDPAARVQAGERAPDGNAVRLDVELTRLTDTESAQMLVGDLWKKYFGLFRTALGR